MSQNKKQDRKLFLWKRILRSRVFFEKTRTDFFVKYLIDTFGTLGFLSGNILFLLCWIVINLGFIPWVEQFDPYPFSLLMVIVALFAILLSILVLMSQNRQNRIAMVHQRIDFEINVRAENEITKILHMLEEIHAELGIAKVDSELELMKEKIDIAEIKDEVEDVIKSENRLS